MIAAGLKGLLWYDPDQKKGLAVKISRAAEAYAAKFGARPNLVLVHPGYSESELGAGGAIRIEPDPYVQPNHFLLAVDPAGGEDERNNDNSI